MPVAHEAAEQDDLRSALRERPSSLQELHVEHGVLGVARVCPLANLLEVREQVGSGSVFSEEDLDQLLPFEDGRFPGGSQPGSERSSAFGSDRVDRPCPASDSVPGCAGEPVRDQVLGFLVYLAARAWPEAADRSFHLLRKLIGRPGLDREQAKQRVGGGREWALAGDGV